MAAYVTPNYNGSELNRDPGIIYSQINRYAWLTMKHFSMLQCRHCITKSCIKAADRTRKFLSIMAHNAPVIHYTKLNTPNILC